MTVPTCLADDVRELPGFLDAAACAGLIARAEAHGFHAATITSEMGTGVHADIRNNDRVILDDPALAGRLWRRLSAAVVPRWHGHRAVGLNTRLRIYRYDPGQTFD